MAHDFVRGWDVADERTFSVVTLNYIEIAEYIEKVNGLVLYKRVIC